MTEQKAKFGVLVQRGKEQYVIEGKEHTVPPELAPAPPRPGWYCTRNDGIQYLTIPCEKKDKDAGGECYAHLQGICQRGEKNNPDSYSIDFGIIPVGEEPIKLDFGSWDFEFGWQDTGNYYGDPSDFRYFIKVDGDVDAFTYYTRNGEERSPNEEFEESIYENNFAIEFDPKTAGNYTASVALQFRIVNCPNCTYTTLIPRYYASNWTIHASCIDRMLEPAKSYDFGSIKIYESKEADFKVKNNIDKELSADIWIDGPDVLDFDIIEGPKGRVTLKPYEQKDIKIKWNPQVLGNQTAKLNISCDNGYWDYCYLLGKAISPCCECFSIYPPDSEEPASEYSFGEVLVGQSSRAQFAIENYHSEDAYVNIKLKGDSDFRIIQGGGIQKIESYWDEGSQPHHVTVEFSPTSLGEHSVYLVLEPCNTSILIKGDGKSAIIFDPWEYDFGGQKIGYCSDTVPFNIKNIGDENAEVSVSIQGDKSKNFELVEGFEGTLYAGSQETVRVRFCPLEDGDLEAYLCAEVKADGSDYINITANLYGRGCLRYTSPYIEVTPQEFSFGDVYVGSEAEKDLSVKSVGCYDANFQLEISGDECFSIKQANTTLTLKPGQMGSYTVKFSPTNEGNFTANILVKGLNCNDEEIIAHGSAKSLSGVLKIEPSSYDFDTGVCNWKCSDSKNFTIYNSASETINFTLSIKGKNGVDFVILDGEGDQSLPPNSYINAEVQFCPKSGGGQKEAFLTAEPYSPKAENISAKITGMALVPCQFTLSPLQYDFGSQLINTCSDEAEFTITHESGNQARLSITLEGDAEHFTITEKPEGLFPIHGSGAIKVKYCPKSAGKHTAYLVVTPDICDGVSATLTGTGEEAPAAAPKFEISPTSFNFGRVLENSCSDIQNFTVRNIGDATGYISANITGSHASNFKIVSQVGSNKISPGGWHSFAVKFCPDKRGDFYAKLWINTEWEGGEIPDVYADLYGVGRYGFEAEFSPSELDFGTVLKNECGEEKEVTLTNTGTRNMTVRIAVGDTKNFTITQGGGYHYLEANQSHTLKVKFCPSEAGNITSYIAAWPDIVEDTIPSMTIHGVGRERCHISISPDTYDFGKVYVGSVKYSDLKIKNEGNGSTTINIEISGKDANDFIITSPSESNISLAAGQELPVQIKFEPQSAGKKQALLVVRPDACNSNWAFLTGEGVQKPACMLNASPANIDFGSTPIHSCSRNVTVSIINTDFVETDVYELSLRGENPEDFSIPEGPVGVVPGLSSFEVPIQFCPSSVGKKTAYLCVKSRNCTAGITVYLQGKGLKTESDPSWDPDPPSTNPVSGRWYAIGAVKSTQSPSYGMVVAHAPKSKWLAYPTNPVYVFYLDHKGCLWMRDTSGMLYIYNLYNGKSNIYDLGSATMPVFALGETSSNGDRIEFCFWFDPGFVVFAEASWGEDGLWHSPSLVSSYPTDFSKPNMIYWYPPYFLFLNKTSDHRLTLWNSNEGLVKSVSLDWSPQYATRTEDGRIWVNSENSNILASFDGNLDDMETIIFSSSRTLNGIGRNSHGDIVAVDTSSNELIILLAEEDYDKTHTVWLPQQWFSVLNGGAARWEAGYSLFTTNSAPFLAIHLEDFLSDSPEKGQAFGGEINNLNLRGDTGLLSHSTWKWSWKPDTKAIEAFLGE